MTAEEKKLKAKSLGAKYAIVIEESKKTLYLKEPDKTLYTAFFSLLDTDVAGAKETAIRSLVIKEVSDMDIFEDYKALLSAFNQLYEIMAVKKSTLEIL